MEKFSHDLTLALEETSRITASRTNRWGRRRTRSTGNLNLPCAPQPTEDSSSSPAEGSTTNYHNGPLAVRIRPEVGNFESDSLNENLSPARPCARRRRKFKRMAVEYHTPVDALPSSLFSGGTGAAAAVGGLSSVGGGAVKRSSAVRYGTSCQENFRANLFFCGKRKRSHRDRYYDYDHRTHQHSSSVPRQRDMFSHSAAKASYMDYMGGKATTTGEGSGSSKIQPLNKNIISKIERIAQDSRVPRPECEFKPIHPACDEELEENTLVAGDEAQTLQQQSAIVNHNIAIPASANALKSGSLESNFSFQEYGSYSGNSGLGGTTTSGEKPVKRHHTRRHHRHKRSAMRMQLQFDDPTFMDCPMADILSSSSLSSSDSETDKTCDSDREGDDELTDWPGNETSIGAGGAGGGCGLAGGDFKRTKSQKLLGKGAVSSALLLPLIKSDDVMTHTDEDTRMSAEDSNTTSSVRMQPVLPLKPGFVPVSPGGAPSVPMPPGFLSKTLPIDMPMSGAGVGGVSGGIAVAGGIAPQIESEMSGETSNHFLSSPNATNEVREFRAGCRRVREERPSFSVITTVNEDISRFLQDGKQSQLRLPDTDAMEHEKLSDLAKLYSLHMRVENGMAVLTKTSNTTQPVRVDRANVAKRSLSDFKRRCYGDGTEAGPEEEHDMNDVQS